MKWRQVYVNFLIMNLFRRNVQFVNIFTYVSILNILYWYIKKQRRNSFLKYNSTYSNQVNNATTCILHLWSKYNQLTLECMLTDLVRVTQYSVHVGINLYENNTHVLDDLNLLTMHVVERKYFFFTIF